MSCPAIGALSSNVANYRARQKLRGRDTTAADTLITKTTQGRKDEFTN
jgi:hypothetical protein